MKMEQSFPVCRQCGSHRVSAYIKCIWDFTSDRWLPLPDKSSLSSDDGLTCHDCKNYVPIAFSERPDDESYGAAV